MIAILKFLHLFSLMLGGTAAGGSTILGALTQRSGAPPPPTVAKAMGIFLKVGLAALVLLWLTGLPLAFQIYGGLALGGLFTAKLLLATLALLLSLAMNAHALKSLKKGTPPDAVLMRRLGQSTGLTVVAVIALTAYIFATET